MRSRSLIAPPAAIARRRAVAWSVSVVALVVMIVIGLMVGEVDITASQVWGSFTGSTPGGLRSVVLEWRLPRLLLGVLLGAALGVSGALFQAATRNPLGSPDILGFSTGAFTGVLVVTLAGAGGYVATTTGALVGGLGTAAVVWALVMRRGAQGFTLVVVGIGITAMISAVNLLLVLRAGDRQALTAAIWAAGSLNGVESFWIAPVMAILIMCFCAAAALAAALGPYELGDDVGGGLGVRGDRVRMAAIVIGVVLVATATAVSGPIVFVALAAPQVARRVWRSGPIPITASAATGAVMLVASDLIAQRLLAPTIIPTGVVTICLGGAYLCWSLTQNGDRR